MSLGFVSLVLVTITAAMGVVTTRNVVHAAVFLGGSFMGVAGLYLLLDAPFIAAAQVLIYVGAITVLILFALMMTAQTTLREGTAERPWKLLAGIVALVLFGGVLFPAIRRASWASGAAGPRDTLKWLANGLLG